MEITVNLVGLQRHKSFLDDERRLEQRLYDAISEGYDSSRSMGIYCEDIFPPAIRDLKALQQSVKERMEFLETLEIQVKQANEHSGAIVDDLINRQVY